MTEAEFATGVVGPRWSVRVPVTEDEQQHAHPDGFRSSSLFLVTQLGITPGYQQGQIWYTLSGPNIRQDGTTGARVHSRRLKRSEAEETYPEAMRTAMLMLADGAGKIIAQAEAVSAEIRRVTGT